MLDLLTRLSRKKSAYVVIGMLVAFAVIGPYLGGSTGSSTTSAGLTSSTTLNPRATTTLNPRATTTLNPRATTTLDPTVTLDPTATTIGPNTAEIDRPGDPANPGALYPGRPDTRDNDHERPVGLDAQPARLGGFSVWIARVEHPTSGPDGKIGSFVKITVRMVNRDDTAQDYNQKRWALLRPDGVAATTSYATPSFVTGSQVTGNSEAFGELWFIANRSGRYWLSFRPGSSSARGVWPIDVKI